MLIKRYKLFEDMSLVDARDYLQVKLASYKGAEGLYMWKYFEDISTYLLIKYDMNYHRAFDRLKSCWEHFGHRLYSGKEAEKKYKALPQNCHGLPEEAGVFERDPETFVGYNLLDGEVYEERFFDERIAALWALLLIDTYDVNNVGGETKFIERYFTEDN
jgi:hypothetical protein